MDGAIDPKLEASEHNAAALAYALAHRVLFPEAPIDYALNVLQTHRVVGDEGGERLAYSNLHRLRVLFDHSQAPGPSADDDSCEKPATVRGGNDQDKFVYDADSKTAMLTLDGHEYNLYDVPGMLHRQVVELPLPTTPQSFKLVYVPSCGQHGFELCGYEDFKAFFESCTQSSKDNYEQELGDATAYYVHQDVKCGQTVLYKHARDKMPGNPRETQKSPGMYRKRSTEIFVVEVDTKAGTVTKEPFNEASDLDGILKAGESDNPNLLYFEIVANRPQAEGDPRDTSTSEPQRYRLVLSAPPRIDKVTDDSTGSAGDDVADDNAREVLFDDSLTDTMSGERIVGSPLVVVPQCVGNAQQEQEIDPIHVIYSYETYVNQKRLCRRFSCSTGTPIEFKDLKDVHHFDAGMTYIGNVNNLVITTQQPQQRELTAREDAYYAAAFIQHTYRRQQAEADGVLPSETTIQRLRILNGLPPPSFTNAMSFIDRLRNRNSSLRERLRIMRQENPSRSSGREIESLIQNQENATLERIWGPMERLDRSRAIVFADIVNDITRWLEPETNTNPFARSRNRRNLVSDIADLRFLGFQVDSAPLLQFRGVYSIPLRIRRATGYRWDQEEHLLISQITLVEAALRRFLQSQEGGGRKPGTKLPAILAGMAITVVAAIAGAAELY